MQLALAEAQRALERGEFPVGAALSIGDRIIAGAHNQIVTEQSLTAHAERLLLTRYSRSIFAALSNRLPVIIYTTLEPCLMCVSTAAHSRVTRIVYACRDTIAGGSATQPPTAWYMRTWPALEHDVANEPGAARMLRAFTNGRASWKPLDESLRRLLQEKPGNG